MSRSPQYPFVPKSTAYLQPGQFWAIPLSNGQYGCGQVIGLLPPGSQSARVSFIAGLVDWVGDQPPTAEAIAGARIVRRGSAHVNSIAVVESEILGRSDLAPEDQVNERTGTAFSLRFLQAHAEARFVGSSGPQRPEHRRLRSPLTEDMLLPVAPGGQCLAEMGLFTTLELQRLGKFFAENPGAGLWDNCYGGTDLEYLRYFPSLSSFRLPTHRATELEGLDGLRHLPESLQCLVVSPNKRQLDLGILRRFESLEELEVGGKVKNIGVISDLTTVEALSLHSVRLADFALLVPLERLRQLRVFRGSTTNLTHLPEVKKLEHLALFAVRGLADLDVLAQLAKLRSLRLDSLPKVERLPNLGGATALTHIRLETMLGLRMVEPIASAPNLEELTMTGFAHLNVKDFECFVGHPALRATMIDLGGFKKTAAVRGLLGLPLADRASYPATEWPPPATVAAQAS